MFTDKIRYFDFLHWKEFMAAATIPNGMSWAIRALTLLLAGLLAYVLVRLIMGFLNPESLWLAPAQSAAAISGASSQSASAQSFNFSSDPFNRDSTGAALVVTPQDIGEYAPETTLNLVLTGRVTGPTGSAILRTPDNKETDFRVGDEVLKDVVLQAVNKDFIVLSVDGQLQRLTFERERVGVLQLKPDEPTQSAAAAAPVSLSKAITGADLGTLFQNVNLSRQQKDGQLIGFTVRSNRPGLNLSQFGLQKGDIVTKIGSTDITQGRPDFLSLFQQAAETGRAEVTVIRNGQPEIIKLGAP